MRRREFIAGLGAATWPVVARGQQPALPVIGYLSSGSQGLSGERLRMFFRGMNEAGLSEGKNIAIEYRWAEGQYDRLPRLAADLVGRRVRVIVIPDSVVTVRAAKAATSTIPVVFGIGAAIQMPSLLRRIRKRRLVRWRLRYVFSRPATTAISILPLGSWTHWALPAS